MNREREGGERLCEREEGERKGEKDVEKERFVFFLHCCMFCNVQINDAITKMHN